MACRTGKVSYATKELADTALAFAQMCNDKNRKMPIRVFYCWTCKRYHMTSQEKRREER